MRIKKSYSTTLWLFIVCLSINFLIAIGVFPITLLGIGCAIVVGFSAWYLGFIYIYRNELNLGVGHNIN